MWMDDLDRVLLHTQQKHTTTTLPPSATFGRERGHTHPHILYLTRAVASRSYFWPSCPSTSSRSLSRRSAALSRAGNLSLNLYIIYLPPILITLPLVPPPRASRQPLATCQGAAARYSCTRVATRRTRLLDRDTQPCRGCLWASIISNHAGIEDARSIAPQRT